MKFFLPFILFVHLISAPVATADETLYDALGGKDGIERIVTRTADLIFADTHIGPQFAHTKKDRLVRLISAQVCKIVGGPCIYKGLNMKKAHIKLGITEHEFNVFVELMQEAMRAEQIPYQTQNKLLAQLAPMKRDIVER